MTATTTGWTCQVCGAAFYSTPPATGLCADCDTTRDSRTQANRHGC